MPSTCLTPPSSAIHFSSTFFEHLLCARKQVILRMNKTALTLTGSQPDKDTTQSALQSVVMEVSSRCPERQGTPGSRRAVKEGENEN